MKTNEAISGTWGKLSLDDEDITSLKAFQAKDEYQKEEVVKCGSMVKGYKITGIDRKGSATFNKVDSKMCIKILDKVQKGITPRFTIIVALDDPDAHGCERMAFHDVVFDDLTLFDFESGALGTVECPFTYEWVTPLDLIG
ncbi:phage-like element PBSX protein xkdM [[Clostridium] bifermentans ATCC 638]|uniref:Phage-like element PBSX protein xkdM n=1 Tax=Paraclostridium bifermentans ATCC 638 = DSM 14991 TaxID=1233171 RepID=T4VQ16_PARBF|nr:phage tail tube protein [Paraclostridium bifermentans]EQK42772.1 phage-like element PBSX protein xkdM [[Clostridium] bifermentans ATCC 638] [Paraclostridium bifermentans ATCC 638 = DSM 14991]RIZ58451.1 hypothetical protein CHH45_11540 [Paraclostridium bifermentans]UAG19570.1 phage tail tube protein [Paraclostridium bifermentans]